jgi:hypothetical protein
VSMDEHQHDLVAMIIDNGDDEPASYIFRCSCGFWFYSPPAQIQGRSLTNL